MKIHPPSDPEGSILAAASPGELDSSHEVPALFSPLRIGSLTLPNRIMISPMCMYSANDGNASAWHAAHLGSLAMSGAGVLFLEATAVQENGRITEGCLGLYNDENRDALKHIVSGIRTYSSMPLGIQLSHAGRKASMRRPWEGGKLVPEQAGGWRRKSSSSVPRFAGEAPADALTIPEMQEIKQAFADAARRAYESGIDIIELHMAHGYLLHQFLSPISNTRTDPYGGAFENRVRFPLEVFAAVRNAVPDDVPVGVRLSATDWIAGGWTLDDTCRFARQVEKDGGAFLDISAGGISYDQKIDPPPGPGYQVAYAARVRECVNIPVVAVGLIHEASMAEEIIRNGKADIVALARGVMQDPRWPWRAAAELGAQLNTSPQLWKSFPPGAPDIFNRQR